MGIKTYIDNKTEDVPALLSFLMKGSGVTVACLLRPNERRGALLLMTGSSTQAWLSNGRHDVPGELRENLTWERAKEIIAEFTSGLEPQQKRLKSQWKAEPLNIDGRLVVKLSRKINAYTILTIASKSDENSWVWSVDITKNIGSGTKHADGKAAWLKDAIAQAEQMALPMVGSVCQILQTYRPQTVDPTSVAGQKPIKTAAVPRQEPVSSFKVKSPTKAKEKTQEKTKEKAKRGAKGQPTVQTFNPSSTSAPSFVLAPPSPVTVLEPPPPVTVLEPPRAVNEPAIQSPKPTAESPDEKDVALMASISKMLEEILK